eukprot:6111941-Pyramimonas_sp.AAC.1
MPPSPSWDSSGMGARSSTITNIRLTWRESRRPYPPHLLWSAPLKPTITTCTQCVFSRESASTLQ